tara:strand:+ start:91 stop:387 length:297 start_codon:yes stop_codon:yes gene_type:complete
MKIILAVATLLAVSACTVDFPDEPLFKVAETEQVRIGEICDGFTFDEEVGMLKSLSDDRVAAIILDKYVVEDRTRLDVVSCYGKMIDFYDDGKRILTF